MIPYFVTHPIDQGMTWVLFDKWQLGALRLLNFATLGILFAALRPHVAGPLARTPLAVLGKSSLEVFCVHLLFCFAALSLVGDGTGAPLPQQVAIVVTTLSGMYAVAYLRSRPKNQFSPAPARLATRVPDVRRVSTAGLVYRPKSLALTQFLFLFLFTVFLR